MEKEQKVKVEFIPNRDRKTTRMYVNGVITDNDIPFVPYKLVDHRGLALFLLCQKAQINLNDVILTEVIGEYEKIQAISPILQQYAHVKNYIK